MKTLKVFTMTLVLLMTLGVATSIARSLPELRVMVVREGVINGGTWVDFNDAQPYINQDGRTMIPVRFVSEALGFDVGWNHNERRVTISGTTPYGVEQEINLVIGEREVERKKEGSITMDTVPVIRNSRTMVPLRFVSEAMDMQVVWIAHNRNIVISNYKYEPGFEGTVEEILERGIEGFSPRPTHGMVSKAHPDLFIFIPPLPSNTDALRIQTKDFSPSARTELKMLFEIFYPYSYEIVYGHFIETIKQENWTNEIPDFGHYGVYDNRRVSMHTGSNGMEVIITIGRFGAGGVYLDENEVTQKYIDYVRNTNELTEEEIERRIKENGLDEYSNSSMIIESGDILIGN